MLKNIFVSMISCVLFCTYGQASDASQKGKIDKIRITAESLKNNIIGESIEREVLVYLPPSYAHNPKKRYPVVYVLHGWGGNAAAWFSSYGGDPDAQHAMESLLAKDEIQEMILVVPDVSTRHFSSWYRNSPVTGNWEAYLTQDLITAIDQRYRTIAKSTSRGLAGHSSGGIGAFMIALTYPEFYGAAYPMAPGSVVPGSLTELKELYHNSVKPQLKKYTGKQKEIDTGAHYFLSVGQLYMADLNNPPSYIRENPTEEDFTRMLSFNVQDFITGIEGNFPQDRYRHIVFQTDVGTREGRTEQFEALVERLSTAGINIELHLFDAGHTDKMNESMIEVLRFMSKNLKAM
jgi:enterochelin esterase-like enzyme